MFHGELQKDFLNADLQVVGDLGGGGRGQGGEGGGGAWRRGSGSALVRNLPQICSDDDGGGGGGGGNDDDDDDDDDHDHDYNDGGDDDGITGNFCVPLRVGTGAFELHNPLKY